MLNWTKQFNICCFLDNHEYQLFHRSHECLLAVGAINSIEANAGTAFEQLKKFSAGIKDWIFGHFAYDLKNETENLYSSNSDGIQFPDLFFFIPEIIVELDKSRITIGSFNSDHTKILAQIYKAATTFSNTIHGNINIQSGFSKNEYIATIKQLRQHILLGNCYEINFCQEFYAEEAMTDPVQTYSMLGETSPAPFAAFYKLKDKYVMCASPERYLKRTGNLLLSQPIKGTWARNIYDAGLDNYYKEKLFKSAKDRSENVMVVDLVRNDLSKICEEGSVRVDELYGVYTFPQVHQMISSVSGKLSGETHWVDVIKATFPMGSMTGAPKKIVLELIEQYEKRKRGIFSGAIGYVSPNGDFDFNVIIRTILYNQTHRYLSYHVGSGITFYSDEEKEYEECLLKAAAIKKVLTR